MPHCESSGPIYRQSMPQYFNRVGRFIDHPWQVDKFSRPIYRPTAAKGIILNSIRQSFQGMRAVQ